MLKPPTNLPKHNEVPQILRNLDKEVDIHPTKTIVKTPCGCGSVEVTKTGDQYIVCAQCGKKFLLIWSSIGRHKQVYEGKPMYNGR